MSDAVLEVDGLGKSYGEVTALEGLTLRVPPGSVGLLGPNGAGKSTLLKLALGLLRPDRGRALVLGLDPRRHAERLELRRRVGYMPEGDCLLPDLGAVEQVLTLGRITGLSQRDAMTRAHEVLDYVGMDEERYRPVEGYSTGMKQRVKLAQALVHDPALLLLDEPTNGLDPRGRRHMLELVHDLGHAQGKNVLFCSHLLDDVERACDAAVVMHRGRLVSSGAIVEMTRSEASWVRVAVDCADPEAFARALAERGLEIGVEPSQGLLRVRLSGEDADELFALAQEHGGRVRRLEPVRSSLEEVFLRLLEEASEGSEPVPVA